MLRQKRDSSRSSVGYRIPSWSGMCLAKVTILAMSLKTIVTLLMLSCLGATGTALGLTEEPPQMGVVIAPPPALIIKEVRWLMSQTSTTIQICTSDDLPDGLPELIYDDGTSRPVNVEGVVDANLNCANFSKNEKYKFNEKPSRYELIVTNTSNPSGALGRGVTTFAIKVKTTLLTCGGSHITKITWSASEVLPEDFNCLEGDPALDQVCYHDEDITGTEFCFGVNDGENDVTVCLNGPTDSTPNSNGTVSASLYYGLAAVSNEPADATLSLAMGTEGLTKLRAIVRLVEGSASSEASRAAKVYGCSSTECTFLSYARTFATYEVCVEAMDDGLVTLETATTTFTDLNLHAFDGGSQKSTLLELVFANGLNDRKYKASLSRALLEDGGVDDTLSTINIDCTSVSAGHACFGFLNTSSSTGTVYTSSSTGTVDTSSSTGTVYLALSSMDGQNTIIAPHEVPTNPGLCRE